ncbi:APC family permease [Clostridiaceae bacterium M8S5]|nr:APC family permease [Clostridiaceae bacterium M8S5]
MDKKVKLGFWSIVLLGINSIIGSGIFGLPGSAYAKMGPASMMVLIFCMGLAISIALCFAEAGSWFDEDGGPYLYAKEAFGDFVGFEVGFMKWAISIIAWSAMANFFAVTLSKIWPSVGSGLPKNIVISIVIIGLGIVNILGVKGSKILNNVITVGKLVPLIFFIAIGVFFIKGGNFTPFKIIPEGQTTTTAFVAASISLFYAFTGFESIAMPARDMINAKKNLPRAIVMVMGIVSIVYFLILAISIGVLGGKLHGATTPVADAAEAMLGSLGAYIITIGTVISVGGINIAASFTAPRAGIALAEKGYLPKFIARKNKFDAPYVAIIITVIGSCFFAWSGTFTTLLKISVITRFIQYIPTCIAVLVFRKKFAGKEVNFKIPGGPIVPVLAVSVSVWLLFKAGMADPSKIIWGLGGLVVGVPIYFIMKSVKNHRTN